MTKGTEQFWKNVSRYSSIEAGIPCRVRGESMKLSFHHPYFITLRKIM